MATIPWDVKVRVDDIGVVYAEDIKFRVSDDTDELKDVHFRYPDNILDLNGEKKVSVVNGYLKINNSDLGTWNNSHAWINKEEI